MSARSTDALSGFEPFERRVDSTSRDAPAGPFGQQVPDRHRVGFIAALQDGQEQQLFEFAEVCNRCRHMTNFETFTM